MIDKLDREIDMLARHLEVLQLVVKSEPIGIVKIANETDHARHEIRYSLRVLQDQSLIKPTPLGATTTNRTTDYIGGFNDEVDHLIEQFGRIHIGRTPDLSP